MKQKKVTQKILKYTVIFEPAKEGGYIASVPALPSCMTQGETFEEATMMIKDAIKGYLSVLKSEKLDLPEEKEEVVVTKVSVANPFANPV